MSIFTAEAAAEAALVTVTSPDEEPKVPPRGQRYNPFNRVTESDTKTVQGSRHRKYYYIFICTYIIVCTKSMTVQCSYKLENYLILFILLAPNKKGFSLEWSRTRYLVIYIIACLSLALGMPTSTTQKHVPVKTVDMFLFGTRQVIYIAKRY